MMETVTLDANDRRILRKMQQNGRISIAALANEMSLSESTLRRKLERLENEGVIKNYTCVIDAKKLGFNITVFVSIKLGAQTDKDLNLFERAVRTQPEILECWLMTGSDDYLLRIGARNIEDLERIHREVLTKLPNVISVNTAIAMREVTVAKGVHV